MVRVAANRLEFRIRPESKQRIQQAADLLALSVGDFVRSAAEIRAEQVIRDSASTLVPADSPPAARAACLSAGPDASGCQPALALSRPSVTAGSKRSSRRLKNGF